MKVLAIRGKNLASLPQFDLSFESGPLANTRIFAITGPTGAGKSTLLDAMCLALYDRVPRLAGPRDIPVGELQVNAQDPRSVMRRGAVEAWAEVDFLGRDDRRYRSSWEVWLARKRAGGKIQSQRMRLFDLQLGQEVQELTGATKTETLELISEKIGLSFPEFRRALLLAQGDFATFLKARPDERAELLEHMTGTELYAELSRAAFNKAKQADTELKSLEIERTAIAAKSEPERNALLEQQEELVARQKTLESELERARIALAWHESRVQLQQEQDLAQQEQAEAERALNARADLTREIAASELAQRMAPVHAQIKQRTEEHEAQLSSLQALEKSEAEQQAQLRSLQVEAHAEALLAHLDAQRAQEEALSKAQVLDVQLQDASELLKEQREELAAQAPQRNLEALEQQQRAHQTKLKAQDEVQDWLQAHQGLSPLSAQWPRFSKELERYSDTHTQLRALERKRAEHEQTLRDAMAKRAAQEEHLRTLDRQLEEAKHTLHSARAELRQQRKESPPDQVQEALERVASEQSSVQSMQKLVERAKRLSADHGAEVGRKDELKTLIATQRARENAQRATLSRLELELEEKAVARQQLEAHLSLAARRPELLADDAPCPLCGSLEHPDRHAAGPDQALLRALDRERTQLQEALQEAKLSARALAESVQTHTQAQAQAQLRQSQMESELEQVQLDWHQRRERLAMIWLESSLLARRGVGKLAVRLPPDPTLPGAHQDLEETSRALEAHRAALRRLLGRERALSEALEHAQSAQEKLQESQQAALPQQEIARVQAERTQHALDEVLRQQQHLNAHQHDLCAALAAPLQARSGPRWADELAAAPQALHKKCEQEVQAFEARKRSEQTLGQELLESERALALMEAERTRIQNAVALLKERILATTEREAKLKAQRALILDGRPAREVKLALQEKEQTLRAAKERAEADRAALNESLAALQAQSQSVRSQAEQTERARAQARDSLRDALRGSEISDENALEALLDRPAGWLQAEQRAQAECARRATEAQSRFQDRQARLTKHLKDAQPDGPESLPLAQSHFKDLSEGLAETLELRARLEEQLEADDAKRARLKVLLPKLASARAGLEQWSELSAVIGASDGKKFRKFAQGLTLDALLEHANQHLRTLRPRYRLDRVPGYDMELQVVDTDMGDEIRAVATLSGGESFLVSLALALGLSSLSSRQVRIESLFIDEGFGSLDRDSLDIALATLDQLQAEGRTVGLISHVPDIAERIGFQIRVEPSGPGRSDVFISP